MYKPQLSEDAVNLKSPMTFSKLASIKLDGIRAVSKFGSLLSRSLKPIPNQHIQELLAPYQDLDGELIVGPANAEDVYRVTSSAVRSEDGKPDFVFYVFDDISVESLKKPFEQRLEVLQARKLPEFIQVLPQRLVNSTEELASFYETVLADGYEGLIVRNPQSMYKFGRATLASQDSLKLKPFADSDFEVLSVYEAMANNNVAFTNELGRTDRSSHQENLTGNGMAGGFEARDCKTGVEFRVAAGTLNHEQRKQVWEKRSELVGKFGKYRHMTVGVKDKPRFPRFIGWREKFDMS
jgi:DNA ligase-1